MTSPARSHEWPVATCLVGLALVALSACSRKEKRTEPLAAGEQLEAALPVAQSAAPARAAAGSGERDTGAPAAGKPASAKPLSAEDKAKRHTFVDALNRGRAATRAHRYDEAVAAFDEAVQSDQDGRAYAERGYTYFLQKRFDLALKDFDEAAGVPADASLAAQVWYNRGLTDAALGKTADADTAFYWSNRINPTGAAASRLKGKSVCPVMIDRTRTGARAYSGFLEWAKAMSAQTESPRSGYDPVSNEAQAGAQFCSGCKGDGPWTVQFGRVEGAWPQFWDVHVLARKDGELYDYGVFGQGYDGPAMGEPCWGSSEVEVTRAGKHTFVRTADVSRLRVPLKVDDEANVTGDCPYDSAWDECRRWCMTSSSHASYVVLDVDRPAREMTVREDNHFAHAESAPPFPVTIRLAADAIELRGEGCSNVPYAGTSP